MENGAATGATAPQAKLTRLAIRQFRNVEPCELRFGDGFNVLLGLNAAGKTTLLEIIAAALSFTFSAYQDEAFAIEYDLRFAGGSISAAVSNARAPRPALPAGIVHRTVDAYEASIRIRALIDAPPSEWSVEANRSNLTVSGPLGKMSSPLPSVMSERPDFLWRVAHLMRGTADPNASSTRAIFSVFLTALASWPSLYRFDEALGTFDHITGEAAWIELRRGRGTTVVPEVTDTGLVPGPLCNTIALECERRSFTDEGESMSFSDERVGLLSQLKELFGFASARLEMRLLKKKVAVDQETLRFGDFRFMFERLDGSVISHDELSYGQKRLLSFFYYLAMQPDTVIADELVDGLHHLWIEQAIEAIGERQAFLASQNPLLLDYLEFESAADVGSTFVLCRARPTADGERLTWSNMSEYDAERIFKAYEVGLQHVSEILKTKGLW